MDEQITISQLSLEYVGRKITVKALVKDIYQTTGPTLFTLFDGTDSIKASAFAGPGKRALPALKEGMAVKAELLIKQWEDILEADLVSYVALADPEQFKRKIEDMKLEKIQPEADSFMIKSEILEKLKLRIEKAARLIKKAIIEGQPIIIRHHADADGYCGAVALERAIIPKLIGQHGSDSAQWKFYRRAPTRVPFYDISDALKDITFSLSDVSKYGAKIPLIILVDNGSSEQDVLAIKKTKLYDANVIVIDHHMITSKDVDSCVDVHLNAHLVGGSASFTAGMLAAEIARFVNKDVENISFLPAIAGIGDRSSGKEFEQYLELAKSKGYDADFLRNVAECVDYEGYYLGYMESRELINDLLGGENCRKLVSLMTPEIKQKRKEQTETALNYVDIKEKNGVAIAMLDIQQTSFYGDYPPSGKITGMLFDALKEKYDRLVVLGLIEGMIIVRMQNAGVTVVDIIKKLQQELPYAMVYGGGHEVAGTIKCVEAAKGEVLGCLVKYL